jgi:hypothetical protein
VGPVEQAVADSGVEWTQALDRLVATGVSLADAEYVVGWYAAPSDSSTTVDDTVERVTGRPVRTFAGRAAEHAERFKSM